jgi:hypothetical protein
MTFFHDAYEFNPYGFITLGWGLVIGLIVFSALKNDWNRYLRILIAVIVGAYVSWIFRPEF